MSLWGALLLSVAAAANTFEPVEDGPAPSPDELDVALGAAGSKMADIPEMPSFSASGLAIPVIGVQAAQIVDTFRAPRAGGARVHNALDIMAPRGTPVVAAADGVVERLHRSGGGGITAYVRSSDGRWMYYYAHLDSYAPGLAVGQRIERGDPIGRVGSTGNAHPAWPHLHFAVHRMSASDRWYQGAPVNPYPLLAASRARR